MADPLNALCLSTIEYTAACEKSVACSTCHCILDPESYDKLEEPTDEENVREDREQNSVTSRYTDLLLLS